MLALSLAGLGVAYTVAALQHRGLPLAKPGPGLLPVVLGVWLTVCSSATVVGLMRRRGEAHSPTSHAKDDGHQPDQIDAAVASDRGARADAETLDAPGEGLGVDAADSEADGLDEASEKLALVPPAVVLLSLVLFIAVMPVIGFLPGIWLVFAVSSWAMGWRSPVRLIATATFLVAVVYVVFELWLFVPLPRGMIFTF